MFLGPLSSNLGMRLLENVLKTGQFYPTFMIAWNLNHTTPELKWGPCLFPDCIFCERQFHNHVFIPNALIPDQQNQISHS